MPRLGCAPFLLRALGVPVIVVVAALAVVAAPASADASRLATPSPAAPTAAATAASPSSGSGSGSGFRCDGTDPFFFEELEKAGTVGYGETWDERVCDEGVELYAEGANARWKALRSPRKPLRASDEDQMLALVMPMFAVGGIGAIFLAAAALAAASRMKKRVVLEVPCPACDTALPIAVDDESAHQLFCPMCGAACAVDVAGKGRGATARARLLQ